MSAAVSHACGPHVATTVIDKLLLCLISEPLLMPIRLHAFAALMLGNFGLASFLE